MSEWRYFCIECGVPISMKYKYCFDHKHYEREKEKAKPRRKNIYGGRGCKDD